MRASYEKWQAQTLPSTVIGDHQNGDPGRDNWEQGDLFSQIYSVQSPLCVFLLAQYRLLTMLFSQAFPLLFLDLVGTPAGTLFRLQERLIRRFSAALLVPSHLPSRIFQLTAFAGVTSFGA